jgi:gliding motility-associated-like protein
LLTLKTSSVPTFRRISLALTFILFLSVSASKAGLVINAGNPKTVCSGDSVVLGGNPTATGGTLPYTYMWSSVPVAGINNPADSNPHAKVITTTWFYLTVTDGAGGRKVDSVLITVANVSQANAGNPASICPFGVDTAHLGGPNNLAAFTYSWNPPSGLSCTNCPHPNATPSSTTTYTMIAKNGGCSDTTTVTVTVLPPPTLTVVSPVTIQQGQTVVLSVSGASSYTWTPTSTLYNANSASPQAFPSATTTYTVIGRGANGCLNFDSVRVIVEGDSDLIFYNTFTPNGDGVNDKWFIGNITMYPNNDVYIYNRYGKQVYYAHGYTGLWDGSNNGDELPDATYYYVVYTGTGRTYNGSVTIIRKP